MTSVENYPILLTIHLMLNGSISEPEMRQFVAKYRAATDSYAGRSHLVLADMRGLKIMSPEVAAILGGGIRYARVRGVACCAHISDAAVSSLQAARLAREADPQDQFTVNVVSLEEAEKVFVEHRQRIKGAAVKRRA